MYKQKLTLSIDNELIAKAKNNKLNLFEFLENCLMEKFKLKRVESYFNQVR